MYFFLEVHVSKNLFFKVRVLFWQRVRSLFLEKIIYKKIFTLTNNESTCQKNVKFDKVLVNVMKKIKNFLKQDLPNNVEASTQALKT